jgi:predicted PurR-regulated permease PerM
VPYPVLLGLLAGMTELLPYVGPWTAGTAAVLVALVSGGLTQGAAVAVLYLVIQQIEGHTLVPVVMNRAVHVNPLTVIVAVLVGGSVLGIVGGVLAVPVAAMIHVLVTEALGPRARAAAGVSPPRPAPPGNGPAPDNAATGTLGEAAPVT